MSITAIFPADVVVPELEPVIGLPAVFAAFVAVIVLEAVLLKLLRWDPSWLRCFLHSLAINVVTTLVGVLVSLAIPQPLLTLNSEPAQILLVLAAFFAASVVIEGFELQLLSKKGQLPFMRSLIIIAVSYFYCVFGKIKHSAI
jgi:hypothetical protein